MAETETSRRGPLSPASLPRFGDSLPQILQRFSCQGLLGLALVRADSLGAVEASRGAEAHRRVLADLSGLVAEVASRVLDGTELLVTGETGRSEVAVLVFRTGQEGGFYRSELPGLAHALARELRLRGDTLVAPYMRQLPPVGVGFAAVVRNPLLSAETQLRALFNEARDDADLEARLAQRRRRRNLLGTVLAGEVTSVYEPIVDVATKTVHGYEALARGPVGTPLHAPLDLFRAAEAEDLVFELDCLCRRSGLDGAVGLPSGTRLFLNVRPTTIHDPAFRPDALVRTLERTNLAPSDVVFEISEQESIANFAHFREIRDEYKALGFRFAVDDTGAGYASLQTVIEIEPDYVKIDRALVAGLDADPSRRSLVRALQELAGQMGSLIVAEGLDTLEELETLAELGIPFGQGWLFGKPTPLRADE